MPGEHNIRNALAAAALAARYDVPAEAVRQALSTFRGVKRRMEVLSEAAGVTVVDDFAHHPTAIRETLSAARTRFPGRRLWAVLEPRSNTLRRRVFQNELVEVLALADRVVLAGVFRGGNIPESERLQPESVIENLAKGGVNARFLPTADAILEAIAPELAPGDVLVVMSNGGFEGIHEKILKKGAQRHRAKTK